MTSHNTPSRASFEEFVWVFLRKLTLLFGDSNVAWNAFISRLLLHIWFWQRSTKPWYASWRVPTRILLPVRLGHPSGLPTGNLQWCDGATSSQWMFKLYRRPILSILQYDSDRNWLWCRWGWENSLRFYGAPLSCWALSQYKDHRSQVWGFPC